MQVEFQRTGERRYGVKILRENLPPLEMNPAPGFDALMPHDLLHFLVEQEFGLQNAIYGQIAVGGTAGTFRINPSEDKNSRADSRLRRKEAKRGKKMVKTGIDEYYQSERATYICWYDWLSHSNNANLQAQAREMKDTAESIFGQMTRDERARYSQEKLAGIRQRMDEISQQWSGLKIGQSMILQW